MSRLNAKILLGIRENEAEWEEAVKAFGCKVRFLKRSNEFVFKCLDSYAFRYETKKKETEVRIKEVDLLRMIKANGIEDVMAIEMEKEELDDDTFNNVSMCQYFFTLSERTVKLIKRYSHLFRLKKEKMIGLSPFLELKPRMLHSLGGRKKGSKNKNGLNRLETKLARLKESDIEEYNRIVYLRDNFEMLKEKYLSRGDIETYKRLCSDLCINCFFNKKML